MKTNLAIKTDNAKLSIAHKALTKHLNPKKKYSVEDYTIEFGDVVVSYYDQFDNWNDDVIELEKIYSFIGLHYSSTIDYLGFDGHEQMDVSIDAREYFEEHTNKVLTDYLNNRR